MTGRLVSFVTSQRYDSDRDLDIYLSARVSKAQWCTKNQLQARDALAFIPPGDTPGKCYVVFPADN